MRTVQIIAMKLRGNLKARMSMINSLLLEIQTADKDHRIERVDIQDDIVYITAALDPKYMLENGE